MRQSGAGRSAVALGAARDVLGQRVHQVDHVRNASQRGQERRQPHQLDVRDVEARGQRARERAPVRREIERAPPAAAARTPRGARRGARGRRADDGDQATRTPRSASAAAAAGPPAPGRARSPRACASSTRIWCQARTWSPRRGGYGARPTTKRMRTRALVSRRARGFDKRRTGGEYPADGRSPREARRYARARGLHHRRQELPGVRAHAHEVAAPAPSRPGAVRPVRGRHRGLRGPARSSPSGAWASRTCRCRARASSASATT